MKIPQKIKIWIVVVAWSGDYSALFHKAFLNEYKAKKEIKNIEKNKDDHNKCGLIETTLIE